MKVFAALTVFFFASCHALYTIPELKIEALKPSGIRVSMPDSEKVTYFSFNGNVNEDIKNKESGNIRGEARRPTNGQWVVELMNVKLEVGDRINYWIYVQQNRFGYDKERQVFLVKELIDRDAKACLNSVTKMNGNPVCGNTLMYEDSFNHLDLDKWNIEQYIPSTPDYEFNSYEKSEDVVFVQNGQLNIKPKLRESVYQNLDLTQGCTAQDKKNCLRTLAIAIVPPVISAQITSKISFLYGKIELLAQLPLGDWMYPQLYLVPKNYKTNEYKNGRLWLAYARGNENLQAQSEDISNNVLYFGPVFSRKDPSRYPSVKNVKKNAGWSQAIRNFTVVWSPEKFVYYTDGEETEIHPPQGKFSSYANAPYNLAHASEWKTPMAPFDKEFNLCFGIGVGGVSDFPDDSTSAGNVKPWKNEARKNVNQFYDAKDIWSKTWTDKSVLRVQSVKVWAL